MKDYEVLLFYFEDHVPRTATLGTKRNKVMNKNTRIASRNLVAGTSAAMTRGTAQSNLFG